MVLSLPRTSHRQSLSGGSSDKQLLYAFPRSLSSPPLRLMSRYNPVGRPAPVLGRHQGKIYVTFLWLDLDYSSSGSAFTTAADTRLACHPSLYPENPGCLVVIGGYFHRLWVTIKKERAHGSSYRWLKTVFDCNRFWTAFILYRIIKLLHIFSRCLIYSCFYN